jgi:ABC-type lipoprotein release transport system permease subunit
MMLLIWLVMTLFFLSSSISYELTTKTEHMPDIILTQTKAGREGFVDEKIVDHILEIEGVSRAYAYIKAPYQFKEDISFTIFGVDPFEEIDDPFIAHLLERYNLESGSMLVSHDVKELMKKAYYTKEFNFIRPDGSLKRVQIAKEFDTKNAPHYRWLIVMSKEDARDILGLAGSEATNIAIDVANKLETPLIAAKLKEYYPNAKVVTKKEQKLLYEQSFNFYSGTFLILFSITLLTFFIIIYDRLSGMSSEERREIGILKAIGWRIEDVLGAKFYEAFFIAVFSYIAGVSIAYLYVFYLKAPLLGNIFLHDAFLQTQQFSLAPHIEFFYLFLVFLLVVPLYFAAVIIPAWRVATLDADEVMR